MAQIHSNCLSVTAYIISPHSSLSISGSPKKRSVSSHPLRNSANSSSSQLSVSSCLCFQFFSKPYKPCSSHFWVDPSWVGFNLAVATVSFRDWSSIRASKLRVRMKHRKNRLSSHCDMVHHLSRRQNAKRTNRLAEAIARSIMSQFLTPQNGGQGEPKSKDGQP